MTLPGIGQSIRYSQIKTEFGLAPSFAAYQSSNSNFTNENLGDLTNLPLDQGIPTSGQMKFSDFSSKSLNVVLDYFDSDLDNTIRHDMKEKFVGSSIGQGLFVVGGYEPKPSSTTGKRIIAHVNVTIGSTHQSQGSGKSVRRNVALKTGVWDTGTKLEINVGASGKILGQGGNAGKGGNSNGQGVAGKNGGSAIGVEETNYASMKIVNKGLISAGFGGGGGGKGKGQYVSSGKKSSVFATSSGGGGGGGQGFPFGSGAAAGSGASNGGSNGSAGADGTVDGNNGGGAGGSGGGGGAGKGGNGGDPAGIAQDGGNSGATKGLSGYAIIGAKNADPASYTSSTGGGTVTGDILYPESNIY
tara:strand:- start:10674 stop:11747 length:1074 start_codon:yes stop_codon:yes gene_type:complete